MMGPSAVLLDRPRVGESKRVLVEGMKEFASRDLFVRSLFDCCGRMFAASATTTGVSVGALRGRGRSP